MKAHAFVTILLYSRHPTFTIDDKKYSNIQVQGHVL